MSDETNPNQSEAHPPLKALKRSLFLISFPIVFITFALPLHAEDIGASGLQIGLLFASFTISALIVRPLAGIGVDKFGRRPFLIAAMTFYLIANSLYAATEAFNALLVARIAQGFGFALLTISAEAMTRDLTDRRTRAAAMGTNIESQTRGSMFGATIAFTFVGLVPVIAWRTSFAIFAVISAIAIVSAIITLPETKKSATKERTSAKFTMSTNFVRLCVLIFIAAFAATMVQPFYLIYLREKFSLELYWLALIFLPVGVVSAILPSFLGRITSKLNRATAMMIGIGVAGVMYSVVPNAPTLAFVIGAFTLSVSGSLLVELTRSAWVGDMTQSETAGRAFGYAAVAIGGGGAMGPFLGGVIYDHYGAPMIFYTASVLMLAIFTYIATSDRGAISAPSA